jgi:hypothetical protein
MFSLLTSEKRLAKPKVKKEIEKVLLYIAVEKRL